MPPKPRTTIPRPAATSATSTAPSSSTATPTRAAAAVRRRRWVHAPLTLVTMLLLHALLHVLAFVLLTEPCLNPAYTTRLRDKVGYFSLLGSRTAIPAHEWEERFASAGVRALFGVGVIQVWFVARFNGYFERAQQQHRLLVAALRQQRTTGAKVGVDTRFSQDGEEEKVGNFVRQLEGVSLTLLAVPLAAAGGALLLVCMGASAAKQWKQTAVVALHLTLLIALPLMHVSGLPDDNSSLKTADTKQSSTPSLGIAPPPAPTTPPPPSIPNPNTTTNTASHWNSLLTLHPNPTFLLPLYYPLIGCFVGTLVSTAMLALDWNVSYQTYPFPLLVGSLVGLALGDLYTVGVVLFG